MALVSKFIEAANYTAGRAAIDYIVIHDEEFAEGPDSAEKVAAFFHNQPKNDDSDSSVDNPIIKTGGSSAHYTVDSNSIVQCVKDGDTAWHAPPNGRSIGIEHDGFAHQTRKQWLDDHGKKMLRRSARLTAKLTAKYGLPVVKLSPAELKAGKKGITGHRDVSAAFGMSSHADPGTEFPWGWYLERVSRYRWRYFVYTIVDGDKVLAKTAAVREGSGRLTRVVKDFTTKNAAAIATRAKVAITRKRVF